MKDTNKRPFNRFTKKDKINFAKAKSEEEIKREFKDVNTVSEMANKFEAIRSANRIVLGLRP